MIPSAFLLLDAMPLTPNAKIDRKALLTLSPEEAVRTETGADYVEPSGFVEATLAGIYARVLGVDRVGVNDNFFELGGDSILTIQAVARAGQAGITHHAEADFPGPDGRGRLALLAQVTSAAAVQPPSRGRRRRRAADAHPAALLRERAWPQRNHWNQSLLLAVGARLKVDSLRAAVAAVVRHHDALRLRFRHAGGRWRQTNAGLSDAIPFEYVDLSALDEPARAKPCANTRWPLQQSLDIAPRARCYAVAYFDFGPTRPAAC